MNSYRQKRLEVTTAGINLTWYGTDYKLSLLFSSGKWHKKEIWALLEIQLPLRPLKLHCFFYTRRLFGKVARNKSNSSADLVLFWKTYECCQCLHKRGFWHSNLIITIFYQILHDWLDFNHPWQFRREQTVKLHALSVTIALREWNGVRKTK